MIRTLPRSTDVVTLVDTFVVSAISSLMLIRLYLFLAGYPKVGGGGLHIAHMIWGGFLMVVALIVAISYVSIRAQWITALVGGLGFGLFIDEIGKFLTSDNNYFFRPAAALIYVLIMTLFLVARAIARRRDFTTGEYLANAIDLLKEAAVEDFDQLERRKMLHLLERAGDSRLARVMRQALEEVGPPPKLSRFQLARLAIDRRYARLARKDWFAPLLACMVLFGAFVAIAGTIVILTVRTAQSGNFVGWIELVAAFGSLGLALLGLARGCRRAAGMRSLERAVLVWILVIQPFAFYEAQFFASAGLLFSLPLLGLVEYSLQHETRREAASKHALS